MDITLPGLARSNRVTFTVAGLITAILLLGLLITARAMLTLNAAQRLAPVSLSVSSDTSLPKDVQALETASANHLFDRDTTTEHAVFGLGSVTATLDSSTDLQAIAIYGDAPYRITVDAWIGGGWTTLTSLKNESLANNTPDAWQHYALSGISTSQLRFQLDPIKGKAAGSATGLKEIALWGGSQVPVNQAAAVDVTANQLSPSLIKFTAGEAEGVVSPTNGRRFTVTLDREPHAFTRAWLVYETYGYEHWMAPVRAINGSAALGGEVRLTQREWTTSAEPIHPDVLIKGSNSIDFGLSVDARGAYTVRNVRLVAEHDTGINLIQSSTVGGEPAYVIDHNTGTGWLLSDTGPAGQAGKPTLELTLTRPAQLEAVWLHLSQEIDGSLSLEYREGTGDNAKWKAATVPTLNGKKTSPGWNHWDTTGLPSTDGLRIVLQNGQGNATLQEVAVQGLQVGPRHPATIQVGYPDAGQYFGRTAFIRGYLSQPIHSDGEVHLFAGGKPVPQTHGGFEATITKDEIGLKDQADSDPWQVTLEAVYPDGTRIEQIVQLNNGDSSAQSTSALPTAAALGIHGRGRHLKLDGAELVVDPDASDDADKIKIKGLKADELPPLDPGMTNVTRGPHAGYRFTPHGMKFKKKIQVTLPFDKIKVPKGMTDHDIQTFYYDTERGHWVVLEKHKLNSGTQELTSLTDHFTDMINATLTVPDHPQAVDFNPTQIKGIKAADPGAEINLIEPPQVNNTGDARLSYPLQLPAGRAGLQPQLAIQYNSSGGNGWLGLGWDLSMPSITIDTRWGTPKYDESIRKELYLLTGQQLVEVTRTSDYVEYQPRVEGAFNRIKRYGSGPGDYWWVVTDKNGTRNVYGGDDSARLRQNGGERVFAWYLNRTIDANGNTVEYVYDIKDLASHNGGESATYTYLKEIRYTGHTSSGQSDLVLKKVNQSPNGSYYRVRFSRETGRLDSVVDGRAAFKTVMNERLKSIDVEYMDNGTANLIRHFQLHYEPGDFDKTRLTKVIQYGEKGTGSEAFYEHGFEYYNMPTKNNGYDAFTSPKGWDIASIDGGLSKTETSNWNGGLFFGFMLYVDFVHIGGGFNRGDSVTDTRMTTSDVNGDGLPDFMKEGSTYYKNNWSHATNTGQKFEATDFTTGSVSWLGHDESEIKGNDRGIHLGSGAEHYFNLTKGRTRSNIDGTEMPSDVNGDGLIDQVSVSGGLSARLNTGSGFGSSINWAGGQSVIPPTSPEEIAELEADFPLMDPVLIWQAPYAGTVNITGSVTLRNPPNTDAGEDGVRIQFFKADSSSPLWEAELTNTQPQNLAAISQLQGLSLTAQERIYVKLSGIRDNLNDIMDSDIHFVYQSASIQDGLGNPVVIDNPGSTPEFSNTVTGHKQFDFGSRTGFATAHMTTFVNDDNPDDGLPVNIFVNALNKHSRWASPYKGKVVITNNVSKQVMAEDVRLRLFKRLANGDRELLWDRTLPGGEVATINEALPELDIEQKQGLYFDISLPHLGDVRTERLQWKPEVRFTNACRRESTNSNPDDDQIVCKDLTPEEQEMTNLDLPGAGAFEFEGEPIKLFVHNPTPAFNVYPFTRSKQVKAWVAPRDGKVRVLVNSHKLAATPIPVFVKLQTTNKLLGQHVYDATDIRGEYSNTPLFTRDIQVVAGQRLFFNVHSKHRVDHLIYTDDSNGQSKPLFKAYAEFLYVDEQHCYTQEVSGTPQETCVPVDKNYRSYDSWSMHFDELCLAEDRCVVVDCPGSRHHNTGGQWPANYCRTTEPNPDYDPNDPDSPQTINVDLTADERAAFGLDRLEYFVPKTNYDYLSWAPFRQTPVNGFYRGFAYVVWNGNLAWDAGRLTADDYAYDQEIIDSQDPDRIDDELRNNPRAFEEMVPRAFGDHLHSNTPIWTIDEVNVVVAANYMRPDRVGGSLTSFIATPTGSNIGVLRRTKSKTDKTAIGPLNLNEGPAETQSDFFDINGDRYPDLVGPNSVVYNSGTPGGGFTSSGNPDFAIGGNSNLRVTDSRTASFSVSLSYLVAMYNAAGRVTGMWEVPSASSSDDEGGSGFSGGVSGDYGSSRTLVEFMDINGDGLPDRIYRDRGNILVRLNLGGDRFGAQETWAAGAWSAGDLSKLSQIDDVDPNAIRVTDTVRVGANVGYSVVSGGTSVSGARTLVDFRDINGDGMADLLLKQHGQNYFTVRINRGDRFDPEEKKWFAEPWGFEIGDNATADLYGGNDVLGYTENSMVNAGGGYMIHFSFTVVLVTVYIWIEPNIGGSDGEGSMSLAMMDINGDSFPDHVYRSTASSKVFARINNTGTTNLLKAVKRPLGGRIELEYARSGNKVDRSDPDNIIEMNASKWVMSKSTVEDGQDNSYSTSYKYFESGYYSRAERDNYGYGHTQTIRADGATEDQFFHNQTYSKKGLMYRNVLRDKDGALYTREENTYDLRSIIPAQNGNKAVRFPALTRTEKHFYEGGATISGDLAYNTGIGTGPKYTFTRHDYDVWGNVTEFIDEGEPNDNGKDDVRAVISYTTSGSCRDKHIIGKARSIIVYGEGKTLRERTGIFDCESGGSTGNMKQLTRIVQNGDDAVTKFDYDVYGNIDIITYPENDADHRAGGGSRYFIDYTYDSYVNTYPVSIRDAFNYESKAAYGLPGNNDGYKYGQPLLTTDINGNPIEYTFDDYGRMATVTGPYEVGNHPYTIKFNYAPYVKLDEQSFVSYAHTQHHDRDFDGNRKANTIDTVLFVDGMKRVLQTKKDATIEGVDKMIVSGRVLFDELGRTIKQYYSTYEPKSAVNFRFNDDFHSQKPKITIYDVLNRTTSTTLPDDSVTSMSYTIGSNSLVTTVTDDLKNNKLTYRDVRELITAVKEVVEVFGADGKPTSATETLWTRYEYDPLKQITKVTDAKGNETTVDYDSLGRRTAITNPDTGRTEVRYDPAGNIITKITARHAQENDPNIGIHYDYEFNRLTRVRNHFEPDHNVTYEYGGQALLGNTKNQVGRIIKTTHGGGTDEREYGKLGEVVLETRTPIMRSPDTAYTTRYDFDSFGRLMLMTFPDGERLEHTYDSGGNIAHIAGRKEGDHQVYLDTLHYDEFEQRTYIKFGNGVESRYQYRDDNRRLDTLASTIPSGRRRSTRSFQQLVYGYDSVGNIKTFNNTAALPRHNEIGGQTNQSFSYDKLYRLIDASGTYTTAKEKQHYKLTMAYDGIHNITVKDQKHWLERQTGKTRTMPGTSYKWKYDYKGNGFAHSQPHAPTKIGERNFTYDANGNQTGWTHDSKGSRRTITWDDDNRMRKLADGGKTHEYRYDDQGQRVSKRSDSGELYYINQFYTVKNGSIPTKHVYAGTTRLVSKRLSGGNETTAPNTWGKSHKGNNGNNGNGGNNGGGNANPGTPQGVPFTEGHPGQGLEHRSDRANDRAKNTTKNKHLNGTVTPIPGNSAKSNNGKGKGQDKDKANNDQGKDKGNAGGNGNGYGNQDDSTSPGNSEWQPEINFLYYYHPDHLGSTGYVSDKDGDLYEHVEYFPFGETWVQESTNIERTPYLFSSKEFDEETKLYYYGARYYDPRTSVWQSADPILDKYLPSGDNKRDQKLPGMGGVFTPYNLGLYTYTHQNPLILRDPDGKETTGEFIDRKAMAAAKAGSNLKTFGWAFLGVAWQGFGFEGLSRTADTVITGREGLTAGDVGMAAFEVVTLGKGGGVVAAGRAMAPKIWKAGLNAGKNTVFWSGPGTRAIANTIGTTIEKTPIGRILNTIDKIPGVRLPKSMWDSASKSFAENAKGIAKAVLNSPTARSTWKTVEEPILKARKTLIQIITHHPD